MIDNKRKFFLLKQSKNFCAAPWSNLYLDPDGTVLTCCVGSTPLGNIKNQSLDDILNGAVSKNIRSTLKNDNVHDNCHECNTKDPGNETGWLRKYYNDLLKSSNLDLDNCEFTLGSVDLRWNNTCNFACIYCVPQCSSKIAAEQNIKIIPATDDAIKNLQDYVIAHQNNLKEIYLAGGEPLLMKENLTFLSSLTNKNIFLRINTNLSNLNDRNPILAEIKKFTNILWTISIDNADANRFEYTRYGANWQTFLTHLEIAKELGKIRFNIVYYIGNALTIDSDISALLSLVPDAEFTINPASGQMEKYCSANNLSAVQKIQAIEKLKKIQRDHSTAIAFGDIQNCINVLNQTTKTGIDYLSYFDRMDQLHHTNWRKVFTELID